MRWTEPGCESCRPDPQRAECRKCRSPAPDSDGGLAAYQLYANPHIVLVPRRRCAADYEKTKRKARRCQSP